MSRTLLHPYILSSLLTSGVEEVRSLPCLERILCQSRLGTASKLQEERAMPGGRGLPAEPAWVWRALGVGAGVAPALPGIPSSWGRTQSPWAGTDCSGQNLAVREA